jgi:hypothetical protein
MFTLYPLDELKKVCNILRVDKITRKVAYGLHKTNPKAAIEYVEGTPKRKYIEQQKTEKFYVD